MPTPRNFEQLLIVKQLYQDANLLIGKGDIFSLSKAIIFLDLSIELALKTILLNLDPSFIPNKPNFNWHQAWKGASDAVEKMCGTYLPEEVESTNLRNLRNGIQHNGQIPHIQDCKRYDISTNNFLKSSFKLAFNLDFDCLRNWDFIQNLHLRKLMNESEGFLNDENVDKCLVGCVRTRKLVIQSIQKKTKYSNPSFNYREISNSSQTRSFSSIEQKIYSAISSEINKFNTKVATILEKFNQFLTERFSNLEIEILIVGMGMLITDTRRFLGYRKILVSSRVVRYKKNFSNETLIEDIEDAKFMLEYLFKLLRFIEDNEPSILESIEIKT
jgi:hypothetical protein